MVEMSDVEKLAVEQAFLNAVADDVKTKEPGNLRGRVDAQMIEGYYSNPMAGKSYDIKLFGRKVGTYSLTVSKGKPQEVTRTFEVDDFAAFYEWAENMGFMQVDMDAVKRHFDECGEVPDGCTPIKVVKPEVLGGTVTRTTVKVDQQEVMRVLGPQLEPIAYALLGGGEDER